MYIEVYTEEKKSNGKRKVFSNKENVVIETAQVFTPFTKPPSSHFIRERDYLYSDRKPSSPYILFS